MEFNKELIERIARIARLKLTEKEIEEFLPELQELINAFSKLDEVDTTEEDIALHPIEIKNNFRDDKVEEPLSQEDALSLTEHKKDGYFKGPKVV